MATHFFTLLRVPGKTLATAVLLLWGCFALQASVAAAVPDFKPGRFDEDYSYIRTNGRRGVDDSLKNVRLDESAIVSIGGEWRERFDHFDAPQFGAMPTDNYLLQRFLLHADLHVGERLRFFVQVGHEDAFGKNNPLSPSDEDRGDIQSAFVDLGLDAAPEFTLRAGRQELLLNAAQRFLAVREGPNTRQSFDGASLRWQSTDISVLVFATHPVRYRSGSFDDASDRSQRFIGASFTKMVHRGSWQVYALNVERDGIRIDGAQGDERRRSIGVCWACTAGSADRDVEAVSQFGSSAGQEIRAWALSASGGYTFGKAWSPRIGVDVNAGSGDADGRGGRRGTFNPLFPKGAYFNESATVSWSNLLMARTGLTLKPRADLTLMLSASRRWRQTGADAVYLQPAVALATTLGNRERHVGDIYQLDASWRVNRYVTLSLQVLHETAGPALREAGGRAIDFAMFNA